MNRTRKSSPRTFKMEPTGPKVPSRYLSGPTSSCHDHCKCETKPTTEAKSTNPSPKRVPRPPADRTRIEATNPAPKINRSPSTHKFKNNNVVKYQTLKKDVAIEPKKRDNKMKFVSSQVKTYNLPSSRTPRRRLSDNFVPNKDMSLSSSRLPRRRLSEIIIHPKTDIASVSNGSTVRGSGINKNESRKDSKLPLVNKKSNSVKTTVSTSKINSKVSPLRTYKTIPKPDVKGPRKSKPVKHIEELVHKDALHVTEPKNGVEISKSQSQKPPDCAPSSSEVKAVQDDQNELVESSSPTREYDNLAKDGQPLSTEAKAMKDDDQSGMVEPSPPSKEDDIPTKDDQNKVVESSSPLMEDDNLTKDGQPLSSDQVKAMKDDDQNEVVESSSPSKEDDIPVKDDQIEVVESSSPPMEDDNLAKNDQIEVVESSSPSKEDDIPAKDDQIEVVESSSPPMEDDNPAKNDKIKVVESSSPSKKNDIPAKDDQNGVVESSSSPMEDDNLAKDDQLEVAESSSPLMEDDNLAKDHQPLSSEVKAMKDDDQNEVVESSPPSIEDDTLANDGQQNDIVSDSDVGDTKEATHVETLVVETDLRFRRGTILSPESENNSLIELQFKKGKELEKETENGENISVDLKHQEMEEKKAAVLNNNVIEEAAGKLIQTRKSKVKALVGAFETIVTNETPTTYTSKSTKFL